MVSIVRYTLSVNKFAKIKQSSPYKELFRIADRALIKRHCAGHGCSQATRPYLPEGLCVSEHGTLYNSVPAPKTEKQWKSNNNTGRCLSKIEIFHLPNLNDIMLSSVVPQSVYR